MNERTILPWLENLSSSNPKIKYGSARQCISLSSTHPDLLLPHFDFFKSMTRNENSILCWTAIDVIGNLTTILPDETAKKQIAAMCRYLRCGKLITAAHAISSLTTIAMAKPAFRKPILTKLLKVEHYAFETDECLNIALGKILLAFDTFPKEARSIKGAVEFINRQRSNSRNATRKKAEHLLKKIHALT